MRVEWILAAVMMTLSSWSASAAGCGRLAHPKVPDAETARRVARAAFMSRLNYSEETVAFLDVEADGKAGWLVRLGSDEPYDPENITVTFGGASLYVDRCNGAVSKIRVWK